MRQQVCDAALKKLVELDPNLIQELIESGNEKYLTFLAEDSETTEENLLKIAKDCNHEILEKIFKNENLKEKSIESLYKKHKNDENLHLLAKGITWNKNTPVKIIKEIIVQEIKKPAKNLILNLKFFLKKYKEKGKLTANQNPV